MSSSALFKERYHDRKEIFIGSQAHFNINLLKFRLPVTKRSSRMTVCEDSSLGSASKRIPFTFKTIVDSSSGSNGRSNNFNGSPSNVESGSNNTMSVNGRKWMEVDELLIFKNFLKLKCCSPRKLARLSCFLS
ncbi:hypothetical protein ACTFIR_011868 [Dictyostelium discoideum]